MPFSGYVAYFDESGDHGLTSIDPSFPVFVLCGCVFKVAEYSQVDLPSFSSLKFKYFGHDSVVFHSRDIRKQLGPFQILTQEKVREGFMADISSFFANMTGTIIAACINKLNYVQKYERAKNPYSLSLLFCLERLYAHLRSRQAVDATTMCVFEERGRTEDNQLAAEFVRICAGANMWGVLPFQIVFANKQTNMPGLQACDLAAYPIARRVIQPGAPNPAYMALRERIRASTKGKIEGWGLKVFP